MNTENDGGFAFPVPLTYHPSSGEPMNTGCYWDGNGMSLRDYFAAKAMQSFVVGSILPPGFDATEQMDLCGMRAYELADAMLKARQKPTQ